CLTLVLNSPKWQLWCCGKMPQYRVQKSVAVKVNKGQEGVLQQAISEIAVLKRMRCLDRDICNVVQWDGFFFDKENICITFELLDMSLRDYMKEQDRGFTVGELKPILYQLATALASLHSIGITHMDLKPDNIMVDRSHQQLKVKLIDFGLARPVSALHQGDCIGTLFYCAPEMLLGVPFDESIDIWALGQVMAELAMGCWLYPGDTHYDMLRYIVETQGQPPDDLLDNGVTLKSLDEIEQNMKQDADHHRDQKMFISLIKSMLTLDVSNRINAQQVLDHEFFAASIPQSPSRDAGTQLTHIDNQQHGSFNVQHSVPSRAAVSLEEHSLSVNKYNLPLILHLFVSLSKCTTAPHSGCCCSNTGGSDLIRTKAQKVVFSTEQGSYGGQELVVPTVSLFFHLMCTYCMILAHS
uniref:Protein kinase domain-containing protein n=1 Tax=Amphiprion ocellaris TaxID=80972 RepID=A0A3Q1BSE8_AMPOC